MADRQAAEISGDGGTGRRPALLAGALLVFAGLVDVAAVPVAIVGDPYILLIGGELHHVDLTAWAWLRVAVGAATAATGLAIVAKRRSGARAGFVVAGIGVVVALVAFPYQPLHSLLDIPVNLAAVRLLLRRR
jgi:hypothetical protein